MGQIKNIKLHIVTDIKALVNGAQYIVRRPDAELTGERAVARSNTNHHNPQASPLNGQPHPLSTSAATTTTTTLSTPHIILKQHSQPEQQQLQQKSSEQPPIHIKQKKDQLVEPHNQQQ